MGTFSHPNSLAGFVLVASLLVVCLAPRWRRRPIIRVWLLLNGLVLLLSFSLAVYLVLILLLGLFLRKQRSWPGWAVGLTVVGLVGATVMAGLMEGFSVQRRLELIQQAARVIKHYPILGAGLGNFIPAAARLVTSRFRFLAQPVHNIYLLWLAEGGLVGLVLAVYWLRRMRGRIAGLAFLPLAVILFLGLFDHYWLTLQQNWLLLGVTLGLWQRASGRDPSLR